MITENVKKGKRNLAGNLDQVFVTRAYAKVWDISAKRYSRGVM